MNTPTLLTTKSGAGTLMRPRYYPGLLLEDDDLTSAVDYTRGTMRLMLRTLFGCGVACGLDVGASFACEKRKLTVTVEKGVALDCAGNLIEVPQAQSILYDPDCKPMPKQIWVVVCYTERCCQATTVGCSEDDNGTVVSRRGQDGFEIRLYSQQPPCACACSKPKPAPTPPGDHRCCRDQSNQPTATGDPAAPAPTPSSTQSLLYVRPKPADTTPDPCACYEAHNTFKCGCDCGCDGCVLIGHITIDVAKDAPAADGDGRRFVRPMLLGALQCYCKLCQSSQQPQQPGRITRDPTTGLVESAGAFEGSLAETRDSLASRQDRLAALNIQADRLETNTLTAQAALERAKAALDAARNDDPAHIAALKKSVDDATRTRLNADLQLQRTHSELTDLTRSIASEQALLARRMAERDLALRQQGLSYLDDEIAAAQAQNLDAAQLNDKRNVLAEGVRKALDVVLQQPQS